MTEIGKSSKPSAGFRDIYNMPSQSMQTLLTQLGIQILPTVYKKRTGRDLGLVPPSAIYVPYQ